MDNKFTDLSRILADLKIFNIDEVALTLKVYFDNWRGSNVTEDTNISDERLTITAKINDVVTERSILDTQILLAELDVREGVIIDRRGLERVRLRHKLMGRTVIDLQAQLANLKQEEKRRNLLASQNEDRKFRVLYFDALCKAIGDKEANKIYEQHNTKK